MRQPIERVSSVMFVIKILVIAIPAILTRNVLRQLIPTRLGLWR